MNKKGYSLHIGVNEVNPNHYNGSRGLLHACENDAKAMYEEIAQLLGYEESRILLTKEATKEAFLEAALAIGKKLKAGDLFLITFSGHGAQVLDDNGDEKDGHDEVLCFYDGYIKDDVIYGKLLQRFPAGARILVVCDNCHSGDILRTDEAHVGEDGRPLEYTKVDLLGVKASVRLLSSSQQDEESKERNGQGVFTKALLKTWNKGAYEGNYHDFYEAIVREIAASDGQIPNHQRGGRLNDAFDNQKPFVV